MNNVINFDELEKELQRDHERQCETNRLIARKVDCEIRVINALRANLTIATDLDRDHPSLAGQMNTRQKNTHELHMKIAIAKHNHKPTAELVEQLNNDAIPDEQLAYLCERHVAIYQEIAAAFQEGGYCGWLTSLAPKSKSHRLAVELARADDETIGRLVCTYMMNRTGTDRLARANFEGLMWLDWAFQAYLKGEPLPQEDVWGTNSVDAVESVQMQQPLDSVVKTSDEACVSIPICIKSGINSEKHTVQYLQPCGTWSGPHEISSREMNVLDALLQCFLSDPAKSLSLSELGVASGQSDSSRALSDIENRVPEIVNVIARSRKKGSRDGYRLQLPKMIKSA